METINLLAGDIDGNDVIDEFDAMTIGINYGLAAPDAADLNDDGVIDVLDLELLAANYREAGALNWQQIDVNIAGTRRREACASSSELSMKRITTLLITILGLFLTVPAQAQTPESIWIAASADSFKTGETLIVTVQAVSSAPIQGFTAQIGYDPACLRPLNAASRIAGMNGLLLPQSNGLVDATFASTAPQAANGILAEARFETLGACQTNLILESAALAVKNEAGFAAPLDGVAVEKKIIPLTISGERGASQDLPLLGTPLPLTAESDSSLSPEMILVLAIIGAFILIGIFVLIRILKRNDNE